LFLPLLPEQAWKEPMAIVPAILAAKPEVQARPANGAKMRVRGNQVKSQMLLARSWPIFLMAQLAFGNSFPRVERVAGVEWVEGEAKADRARRAEEAVTVSTAA
jgi:hypothetical protein